MILKNQEVHYARLTPSKPDRKTDPTKPFWSIQLRTLDKAVRKSWVEAGMKPRAVRADKEDDESALLYYSVNLRKYATKADTNDATKRVPAPPVTVVNGRGDDVDPATIGNGSICNIRFLTREYTHAEKQGIAITLMGVQVVKHKLYVPKGDFEDFEECETEVIQPEESDKDENDDIIY